MPNTSGCFFSKTQPTPKYTVKDLCLYLKVPDELENFLKKGENKKLVNESISTIKKNDASSIKSRDFYYVNKERNTPLFIACKEGLQRTTEILIRYGAEINKPSKHKYYLQDKETGEILKDYCYNKFEITPIETALSNRHYDLARYLLSVGADKPDHASLYGAETGNDILFLWEKINNKSDESLSELIRYRDKTPYHWGLLQLLLASTDEATQSSFYNVFILACKKGDPGILKWIKENIDISNSQQCAGFVAAWQEGKTKIIDRLILDWKFDIHEPDDSGNTVLDYLDESQKSELHKYLKTNRAQYENMYTQYKNATYAFYSHSKSDVSSDTTESEFGRSISSITSL